MKKSLAIALICIFFSFAASAAEQFVFLSQKGNDVYFLLDCIISDSTEFYRPMQVNKGSSFVCFFNLTDIEHEVYSAKPRFEGKSFVKNTSVCYVAMVLHKGNWYVGEMPYNANRGTGFAEMMCFKKDDRQKALEMLYILSYLKYYGDTARPQFSYLLPKGTVTEGIENDRSNIYYFPKGSMTESGSIPICTYHNNEEIFEKIKKSFGYYTYSVAGNWLAICLDETGDAEFRREGQPSLDKKDFIVKWGEVSLVAVKQ